MKTLAAFLGPLIVLIPTVFALVTQLKKALPKVASVVMLLISMAVGVVFTLVANYLTTVDGGASYPLAIVLLAGVLVGGGASGLFDFGKLVGVLGTAKK